MAVATYLPAALLFSRPASSSAEWKIRGAEGEASPNGFVEHWKTVVENETSGERATLHMAVFDGRAPRRCRVIDQPDSAAPRAG